MGITLPDNIVELLPRIEPGGLALYCYLLDVAGESQECSPSYDMIQKATGLARATIKRYLGLLIAAGLISEKRRFSASTVYTIVAISSNYELAAHLTTTTVKESIKDKRVISSENELMDDKQPSGEVTHFQLLSSAVVEFAHFQEYTGGSKKWIEAIQKLEKAGVEPDDIKNAVSWMTSKGYTMTGPWSLLNPATQEMSKRKRNSDLQTAPSPALIASEVYE